MLLVLLLLSLLSWSSSSKVDKPHSDSALRSLAAKIPHFLPLSPCGCDINRGICDQRCCCDRDCPPSVSESTSCQGGLFGGQDIGRNPDRNCTLLQSFPLASVPERRLLCLTGERNKFLGHFRDDFPVLETPSKFKEELDEKEDRGTSFRSSESMLDVEEEREGGLNGYTIGESLETVYDQEKGLFGKLKLPGASPVSGRCVTSTIRFLKDTSSSCWTNPSSCSGDDSGHNLLSVGSFLRKGKEDLSSLPLLRSDASDLEGVPVTVRYHRTEQGYKYRRRVSSKKTIPYGSTSVADSAEIIMSNIASSNQAGDLPWSLSAASKEASFSELDWDEPSSTCRNFVAEAHYEIVWNGTRILRLEANLLLADVSLKNSKEDDDGIYESIVQSFSTSFKHISADEDKSKTRSGNPGYEKRRPILSGIYKGDEEDEKAGEFELTENALRIWSPDATSLCSRAETKRADFGQDQGSGCLLRLGIANFSDCQALREEVTAITDATLLGSSIVKEKNAEFVVSKGGFLVQDNGGIVERKDFVRVLFEGEEEEKKEHEAEEIKSKNGTNAEVSSALVESLLSSPQRPQAPRDLLPSCSVPAATVVKVFYSRAEVESEGHRPVYRVNGVLVSRKERRWRWECRTAKLACPETRNFQLESLVLFEEIPLVWHHRNTSRFWLGQHSTLCEGDTCWKEMAWPFTDVRTGWEVSLAAMRFLLLFALAGAAMYLTSDYW